MESPLIVESSVAAADSDFLSERINEFNFATTGIRDGCGLGIFHRVAGEIAAGLTGWTWGGCLYLQFLWVRQDLRGAGWGTRLMDAAEAEARARGCFQALLETHSFQAPGFYRARGYDIVGEAADYPRGHSQLLMRKLL